MAKFGYVGNQPDASSVIIARQVYNATSAVGVVTFTSGYNPGYLDVYLNGVRLLEPGDYSASDGSTIILTTNTNNGDVIEAVAYKALNISTSQIGINSGGTLIKNNVETLNFIGAGNTFKVTGTTVDIAISGGSTADVSTSSLVVAGLSTLGNVTAGVVTANQLSGSVSGVAGTFTGQVSATQGFSGNVSGVAGTFTGQVSATQGFSGNVSGAAATFTGDVLVGGTLTYDDVTNIDSIGLVTARNGLQVLAGITTLNGQVSAGNVNVTGVVTATSFTGSGANLTNLPAGGDSLDITASLFI
jgi:hypothetical protein